MQPMLQDRVLCLVFGSTDDACPALQLGLLCVTYPRRKYDLINDIADGSVGASEGYARL
jgi:hypothetical protein